MLASTYCNFIAEHSSRGRSAVKCQVLRTAAPESCAPVNHGRLNHAADDRTAPMHCAEELLRVQKASRFALRQRRAIKPPFDHKCDQVSTCRLLLRRNDALHCVVVVSSSELLQYCAVPTIYRIEEYRVFVN